LFSEAIEEFQKALEINPQYENAARYMEVAKMKRGDFDKKGEETRQHHHHHHHHPECGVTKRICIRIGQEEGEQGGGGGGGG